MIPLSVYLHWPWCIHKCPYCDFNSHEFKREKDSEEQYVKNLLLSVERLSHRGEGRQISTIYLGGGTPSLLSPSSISQILEGLHRNFDVAPNAEISMEANPGTFEYKNFAGYRKAGINRLSIGIQSFDDQKLKVLGRIHSSEEAKRAAGAAAEIFENFNLDLMFALPGQTFEELEKDISTALSFGSTHLSYYQLTIEPNTYFGKYEPANLPDDDIRADMGDLVAESLVQNGFEHYEISGYAKPGFQCRHNLNYWQYGDYFGIGPGAHGKLTQDKQIWRTVSAMNPELWREKVQSGGTGLVIDIKTPQEDIPFEFMLNALRLREGVPTELWEQRTFLSYESIRPTVEKLQNEGMLVKDPNLLKTTETGWNFLNYVQEEFLCTN